MHEAWIKQLLLGVERAPDLDLDGAIGQLLRAVSHPHPANAFASQLGVLGTCTRAGWKPVPCLAALPLAPPDEAALPESDAWSEALREVFEGVDLELDAHLRIEALHALARRGHMLPHGLLPQALQAARAQPGLRPAVIAVLGARGRWLAGLNPDWQFASEPSAMDDTDSRERWRNASHAERVRLFNHLRDADPALSRALLEIDFTQLPAREKLDLVVTAGKGLGDEDINWLTPLLGNRSVKVREQAASLLALLPDSAHARQLEAWLATCLTERKRLVGTRWQINAPEAVHPSWQGASVEHKRPSRETLGERAWWLYQLVRQVRLPWWQETTGMTADRLVAWARKTDWSEALLRGWHERVDASHPDWIEALMQVRDKGLATRMHALAHLLPLARRESHWSTKLADLRQQHGLYDIAESVGPGQTLSRNYSLAVAAGLPAMFVDDSLRMDHHLRRSLLDLLVRLHPAALDPLVDVPVPTGDRPAMQTFTHSVTRIIRLRRTFSLVPATHSMELS